MTVSTLLLLGAALLLAAVFGVAGVAKLVDRRGTRRAVGSFVRAPDRLAGAAAVGLPLAELAIAILLLPAATRTVAAAAALALLLLFCAVIALALVRGEAPECHCFGQLHSSPVGWTTLARNLGLAALAVALVLAGRSEPGPGVFAWAGGLDGAGWGVLGLGAAFAAALVGGGYVLAHVLRSYGRVLVRLDAIEERLRAAGLEPGEPEDVPQLGLAPGTAAPAFWLPTPEGDRVALDDLLAPGRPVLLLFTSPSCGPCTHLMPAVAEWQRDHADVVTVALLSSGEAEAVRAEATGHGLVNVLHDEGLTAYESYGANGTPSAVLVAVDGTIASWLAAGSEWIEALLDQALEGLGRTPGLPVGSELPDVRVRLLDGAETELADAIERDTVLVFWNPGCGFCRSMHDEVLAWEASPPPGAPALVIVSSGVAEDVRAEGFGSRVVLDPDWELASRLGSDGTPTALLVGPDRRIASPIVTGAPAALGLLGAVVPTPV